MPADEVPEVFDVILDEYCFRRMYIPCNVRGFLADYIEEHMNIATTFKHKRTEPAILTMRVGLMLQTLSIEVTTQSFVAVLGLSSAMIMPFALEIVWSLLWTTHALTSK